MKKIDHSPQATIIERLNSHASNSGSNKAFTFLGESQITSITFKELQSSAQKLAASLRLQVEEGERVAIMCPPGLDYIKAFFGCLYAGVVAVPLYPPKPNQKRVRFFNVMKASKAKFSLVPESHFDSYSKFFDQKEESDFKMLKVTQIEDQSTAAFDIPPPSKESLAFIQYTSGSTGDPKGVMISHSNIQANLEGLRDSADCTDNDVFVNWLPLYHDLGLINTMFLPVYLGCHSVLMSPVSFIKAPKKWIEAISHYKGTVCGAPNFAYELCSETINVESLEGIDLSSWRIAFNAAEPINANSIELFSKHFSDVGFSNNAWYPAYGMAEATVFLTGGRRDDLPVIKSFDSEQLKKNVVEKAPNGKRLVGCGTIIAGHNLLIVDRESCKKLSEESIGEIWVAGPSISKGYWLEGVEDSSEFSMYTSDGDGPYYRTGDLGFVSDGELFVTGRINDVVILHGQNFYPQDIELTCQEGYEGLVKNGTIAFANENAKGKERVVIIQEVALRRLRAFDFNDARRFISADLFEEHEIKADIFFVKQGDLPRTSSGKLQRSKCKKLYLSRALNLLEESQNESTINKSDAKLSPTEMKIAQVCKAELDLLEINPNLTLLSYGMDSIDAVKVINQLEKKFSVQISVEQFFELSTVKRLAQFIEKEKGLSAENNFIASGNWSSGKASYEQNRLWLMSQANMDGRVLSLPLSLKLEGYFDFNKIKNAITQLVDSNPILRTTYSYTNGELIQTVNTENAFELEYQELETDGTDIEAQIEMHIEAHKQTLFDLGSGPVFRAKIISVSEQLNYLLFNVHHIAADGWSLNLMLNQLKRMYLSEVPELSEFEVNYIDYAHWQEQHSFQESMEEDKAYWLEHIENPPEMLELPFENRRTNTQSLKGKMLSVQLSNALIDGAKSLSKKSGTTLFTTLLTCFDFLMYRLTGTSKFVIGTDVANRKNFQLSNVVGFFVNQLPLVCEMNIETSFNELLKSNHDQTLKMLQHSSIPFDLLIDALNIDKNRAYAPLFQVKFLFNNSAIESFDLPNVKVSEVPPRHEHSQFDLTLNIVCQSHGRIDANFHYNSDLFTEQTIQQFAVEYQSIISAVTESPSISLKQIESPITSSKSYRAWSVGRKLAIETKNSISQLIEKQAKLRPLETSVVDTKRSVNFKELEQRTNQLANFLTSAGIGKGACIGIHLKRSVNQIIAILASMKVGATFVPLDPNFPDDRIQFMIEDSMTSVIFSDDSELLSHLELYGCFLVELDEHLQLVENESIQFEPIDSDANDPAYIIYTSGSTGKPKGVSISQSGISNLCHWYTRFAGVNDATSFIQPIPLSFDASIKNILTPLMNGAKLVLTEDDGLNITSMLSQIEEHKVNIINCVPSVFYLLLEQSCNRGFKQLESLQLVALGGEKLDLSRLKDWLASAACFSKLANIYGPTECTDISTAAIVTKEEALALDQLPIGKPIDNVRSYVVDSEGRLSFPGVPGELIIAGAGVSKGYVNNGQLTDEKFETDSIRGSGVMYRTGDLVKWDQQGNLNYLGRKDNQIKVNGVRIEKGEIESLLCGVSGIRSAAVIQKDSGLVAFLEASSLNAPTSSQLKAALAQSLPSFWLPRHYEYISSIPLLPNAKVDENALRNLSIFMSSSKRTIEPAESEMEKRLVDIWKLVLGLDEVGVNESFFELGGDSISAVRVSAKGEEEKLVVNVTDIFECNSIRELAKKVNVEAESEVAEEVDVTAFDMLSEDDLSLLNK